LSAVFIGSETAEVFQFSNGAFGIESAHYRVLRV
jgi:hypothetical protein